MGKVQAEHWIKRGPLSTKRQLIIDPLFIELGGPLANTCFSKEDIEAFRFGISTFHLFAIPVSRTYQIEIKNSAGKILLIRMHCFFWLGIRHTQNQFMHIHNQIHDAYFNDMAIHYIKLLRNGMSFELAGLFLTEEGIQLKKGKSVVPWNQLGLHSYFHSCMLYNLADPACYRSFDYWHDWNAPLLRTVVDYTIRNHPYFEWQK